MVRATQRSALQAISKLAFAKDHRLTVVAALLTCAGELVHKQMIATATGIPETTVYYELVRLEQLGVLGETSDDHRVWYCVIDGPFWAWAKELLDRAARDEVGTSGPTPSVHEGTDSSPVDHAT